MAAAIRTTRHVNRAPPLVATVGGVTPLIRVGSLRHHVPAAARPHLVGHDAERRELAAGEPRREMWRQGTGGRQPPPAHQRPGAALRPLGVKQSSSGGS